MSEDDLDEGRTPERNPGDLPDPESADKSSSTLFGRLPLLEREWIVQSLRDETVGGVLLMIAAAIGMIWVNSAWGDYYIELSETTIGPEALKLNLTLKEWASDGLLAIFFFVAGVELRHELELGTLANPRKAAVPIAAALGGMAVPAIIYAVINLTADEGLPHGWGIPIATDIAFALAILAVVGRRLPIALRAFLLSLAVVDDLGAITVIAIFYSTTFNPGSFAIAVACLAVYWLLMRERFSVFWVYLALVVVAWGFMHASGVHATVAGVAAGLLTRVKRDPGETESPADRGLHKIQPISAGIAVPIFAFFAAGVDLRGSDIVETIANPVAIGVIAGLVIGKPVGVVGTAWLMAKFTSASLSDSVRWRDVMAVGFLAGIGFTVSLLVTELAFVGNEGALDSGKIAVLIATVCATILASLMLLTRNRFYAEMALKEEADADDDGIPDVYQTPGSEALAAAQDTDSRYTEYEAGRTDTKPGSDSDTDSGSGSGTETQTGSSPSGDR
jgi:NhaA family Na+:H+ antiporter